MDPLWHGNNFERLHNDKELPVFAKQNLKRTAKAYKTGTEFLHS